MKHYLFRFIMAAALSAAVFSCSEKPEDGNTSTFKVSFDTDGGYPIPETQHIKKGGKVVEPTEIPQKEGFVFTGWYTQRGLKFNFVSNPVTADITLIAHWWEAPAQYILINDYSWNCLEKAISQTFGTPEGKKVCAGMSALDFIFGRSDDENAKQVQAHMDAAVKYDCPVLFNFDPITFWDEAPELWNWFEPSKSGYNPENKENVEWYGWGSEYAVKIGWLNWGAQCRLAPMANLFSPAYQAEVEKRLCRYYEMIKNWYESLPAGKKHLLVGVKCVGELALGVNNWYYPNGNYYYDLNPTANDAERLLIDPQTGINMYDKPSRGVQTIGYAAATYSGIKTSGILTADDITEIQCRYSAWLADMAARYFPRELVFTQAGGVGDDLKSTVNKGSCPSWSFYLGDAYDASNFKDAMTLIEQSDAPYWAVSEWAIGADEAPEKWASGIESALNIAGCRYVNICTNVIGNNNGTTVNSNAVQGVKSLCK